MRALANARLFWVRDGALPLEALPGLIRVPRAAIPPAIDRLCDEGIVEVSEVTATVKLTECAAREIVHGDGADAATVLSVIGP
jgi:hypothetical protein